MSTMDKLASELKTLLTESDDRKPKPYDTDAKVVRVEDDILWVHIPGGVEETPIKKTINAAKGDNVKVHIANGTAWITGNETAPPTDDTVANAADSKATDAKHQAMKAFNYADEAQHQADRAREKADLADKSAKDAGRSAEEAKSFAVDAEGKAIEANNNAAIANTAANASTYHLQEVEQVVDVLNWISQHGQYALTNDEVIVEGKWYFKVTSDGAYVVENPISNPHNEGFYELSSVDKAVSNYVTTHLYLVDGEGLYIRMAEDHGAKLKITGTGIYLINHIGKIIAQYSNTVILGDPNGSHIELSPTYGLGFYQTTKEEDSSGTPTNRIAYIQQDRLFIQSATLTNNLQIGNFRWVVLDHRISLKYNPI